ncbi:HAD-IIIC family phosphatase [Nocardia halotolerans]|uniref:HAD-IIIC family phosphatase n=1 Tax=Nocardia halotolerans TaxID=1755878 RepID=A0ABV8VJ43_9NOCA
MTAQSAPVKCLVWDLDNTLWEGTLLEGGAGTPFETVRRTIETLDRRGILNSIASKNDYDLAWQRLEEAGLAEYFVIPKIGWWPKSRSVREIAEALKFAPAAVAFVDDQPAERAEVQFHLPEVRCYTAEQVATLTTLSEFTPATATVDSRQRRQMYQAGFRRDAERDGFDGPDHSFLRTLELELRIERASEADLARVEELTARTTQMNTTGVHYPAPTLRGLLDDPRYEVLVATLSDRFGPYGAIGIVLLEKFDTVWHLELFATSCRVVSIGVGGAILDWLSTQAARNNVHLIADFRATDRNRIMEVTYRFAGYTDDPCDCRAELATDGQSLTRLHLLPAVHEPPTTLRLSSVPLSPVQLSATDGTHQ